MAKVEELIKRLCSNGVEHKALGELGQFISGLSGKSKTDFVNGNKKFISYMNIFKNAEVNIDTDEKVKIGENEKQNKVEYGDIIFTSSSENIDECAMSSVLTKNTEEELYLNSFCFIFRLDDKKILLPSFSKHLFRSHEIRKQLIKTASGVTRFNVSKKKMENIKIPIPPLEVQDEIVRILDDFILLSAELSAELKARQVQYEYYRNKLLENKNKTQVVFLEDILKIKNGKDYKHLGNGDIPVYGTGGIMTYVNQYSYNKPSVLIPRKGSLDKLYYVDKPFWNVDTIFYTEIDESKAIPKYIYYYLQNEHLEKLNKAGGVPSLTQTILNKIKIVLPNIGIQNKIINVLDNFDKICSDLKIGLPAEIEARQKQYEFYRDTLLTYVATGEIILQDKTRQDKTRQDKQ